MTFDELKFKKSVMNALMLDEHEYNLNLKIGDIAKWDSVGHLSLMFMLESDFEIKFEMEKIPELNSIEKIIIEIKKLQA